MNRTASKILALMLVCLLLSGCGSKEMKAEEQPVLTQTQEQTFDPANMPVWQETAVGEAETAALVTAMEQAVAGERFLWNFTEITDTQTLMKLMQSGKAGAMPDMGNFPGGGQMPQGDMSQWDGEMPDMSGEFAFPEGMNVAGRGGMPSLAIVIACSEDAAVSLETVMAAAQDAAEAVGLRLTAVEVAEDTGNLPPVADGLLYKTVVFVNVARSVDG